MQFSVCSCSSVSFSGFRKERKRSLMEFSGGIDADYWRFVRDSVEDFRQLAVSLFGNMIWWHEKYWWSPKSVSDDKIQITILILRRGALSREASGGVVVLGMVVVVLRCWWWWWWWCWWWLSYEQPFHYTHCIIAQPLAGSFHFLLLRFKWQGRGRKWKKPFS